MFNNTDNDMDYILKDTKKFYTVSLCYYELDNINEADSGTKEIFKLKNIFVGSFNDVEERTLDFYSEFCDMSMIAKHSNQYLIDKYRTSDKYLLYNNLVKATEQIKVKCVNFHNITISIADHELSDFGLIHRSHPNIVLSLRMVEDRLLDNANDGDDEIENLLIDLRDVVMEKFQLKYFDPGCNHLMSCRGSEKGYIIIPSTSSVNNNFDKMIDNYSDWTPSRQSMILQELDEFVSTQEREFTAAKKKMLEDKPLRTTMGQLSNVKKFFDLNPYLRNKKIADEVEEKRTLVVLEDDSTDFGFDNFMDDSKFLRPGKYNDDVVSDNSDVPRKSNLKTSTYSNTDWEIIKCVRFMKLIPEL